MYWYQVSSLRYELNLNERWQISIETPPMEFLPPKKVCFFFWSFQLVKRSWTQEPLSLRRLRESLSCNLPDLLWDFSFRWTARGDSDSLETMGFLDVFGCFWICFTKLAPRRCGKTPTGTPNSSVPIAPMQHPWSQEFGTLRASTSRVGSWGWSEVDPCSPHFFWCMLHRFCADSEEFRHDNTKTRAGNSGNPNPSAFLRLRDRFESYPGGLGLGGGLGRIIFEVIIELDQEIRRNCMQIAYQKLPPKNCNQWLLLAFVTTQMVDIWWISFHKKPTLASFNSARFRHRAFDLCRSWRHGGSIRVFSQTWKSH